MSSHHIMEDPSGAKVLEGPDTAKGPEVHVGARETTDQGGALDDEPQQSQRDRGTVFYIWVICASYLFVHYISFHFLS